MATSLRGNAGSGKEKRGTSPSSSIMKRSPKPSTSSPSDEQSNPPAESNKPVPNYLKPTISSSHDHSRVPRKPITDTSSKPTLNRRRSFERPPPSSQVQRAVRGLPSGTRDVKPLRSTSFSNKSTASSASSSRPTSEKLFARTSSLKDGKVDPQLSRSRSTKRSGLSSSTSTKKEPTSSSSSTKKAPKSVNSESSVEYENRSSVDHLAIEDEFVNIDDHEVESLPEMSEMPESNKELADPTNIEMEEAVQHTPEAPKEASLEEDHQQDEDKLTFVVDQTVEESADHQPEVEAAGEQTLVDNAEELHQQDEADKKVTEMAEPVEPVVDEKKEEEAAAAAVDVVEAEKEEVDTEAKDENQTVSSPPADAATAPVKTQAASAGKKDKQVYNDVIEETATKLRGKKNKVLALAGAFETVISLQDTNKS